MRQEAEKLKAKGRFGDTELVHMNPIEVEALASLSPTGKLTTNPDTGQPEAFLPLLGALAGGWAAPTLFGSAMVGGLSSAAIGSGLGSMAGSLMQGDSFKNAALGGMLSFGLGSMLNAAGGAGGVADTAKNTELANEAARNAAGIPAGASMPPPPPPGVNSIIPQPAKYAELGFGDKMSWLGNRAADPSIGWGGVAKDALTGSPVGTMAATAGALGGGLDALMSPGAQPQLPTGVRRTSNYDRSEKFPAQPRQINQPGSGYTPGVDPEHAYFTPMGIRPTGYADGGSVDGGSADEGMRRMQAHIDHISARGQHALESVEAVKAGKAPEWYGDAEYWEKDLENFTWLDDSKRIMNALDYVKKLDIERIKNDAAASGQRVEYADGGIIQPVAGYRPGIDPEHNYFPDRGRSLTPTPISSLPTIPGHTPTIALARPANQLDGEGMSVPGGPNNAFDEHGNPKGDVDMGKVAAGVVTNPFSAINALVGGAMELGKHQNLQNVTTDVYTPATAPPTLGPTSIQPTKTETLSMSAPPTDIGGGGGYNAGSDFGPDTTAADQEASLAEDGWADGGEIDADEKIDPIVSGAVAAIMGQHPNPEQAIQAFLQVYGQEALAELRNQVIASQSKEQRQEAGLGGLIEGPGTGTSDSIPGQIMQNGKPVEDIKVADGEFILPTDTVEAVGVENLNALVAETHTPVNERKLA
jgi:hypothetical protein